MIAAALLLLLLFGVGCEGHDLGPCQMVQKKYPVVPAKEGDPSTSCFCVIDADKGLDWVESFYSQAPCENTPDFVQLQDGWTYVECEP